MITIMIMYTRVSLNDVNNYDYDNPVTCFLYQVPGLRRHMEQGIIDVNVNNEHCHHSDISIIRKRSRKSAYRIAIIMAMSVILITFIATFMTLNDRVTNMSLIET